MLCLVCGSDAVVEELDAGRHPVSSFFLREADAPERKFRVALGQCAACGTVQSTAPVPHDALVAPYDWLFAREPEEHLDEVVEQIAALPGIGPRSVIAGLTYKDDSTVERFAKKGFANTCRVQLAEDLGVSNPNASIETVQKLTTPDRMAEIAVRRGQADVLIVRHITEHTEDPAAFLGGLAELVKPGGILMLEVPDCTQSLQLNDYCMLWEEHSLYLTPATFAPLSSLGGFEPIRTDVYPRPFENSLVQLARKTSGAGRYTADPAALAQNGWLKHYAAAFEPTRRETRTKLQEIRATRGPIALFGAGHLACAFANFLDVADLIDFVADDTPEKQGKFLPGARLPILPSAQLVERGVALCLLALSINNEDKVIARNAGFTARGGEFRSVFRSSPRTIFADTDQEAPSVSFG
jgi:hypothetical protein